MSEARRHLQALPEPAPPPPLPDVSWIWAGGPRRPGELYEGLRIPFGAGEVLLASAERARMHTDLAGTLLVEMAFLREHLDRGGVALAALDRAAAAASIERRLSAAEAAYLKAIRGAVDPGPTELIPIPVRLLGVTEGLLRRSDEVFSLDADRARRWEAAAVCQGGTMVEWGLRLALIGPD